MPGDVLSRVVDVLVLSPWVVQSLCDALQCLLSHWLPALQADLMTLSYCYVATDLAEVIYHTAGHQR